MTNLIERVAVTLKDGNMLYLCRLQREFKKEAVKKKIEEKGQYILNDRSGVYHIPKLTTKLIETNSRGILLATELCPHCIAEIIMTIRCIVNEEISHCCNCSKHLYQKNKNIQKKRR